MAEETSTTGAISFTEPESKLLIAIMQNLTSDIQVRAFILGALVSIANTCQFDADTIATQLGYKDGSIVKARWGQIKRKKLSACVSPAGIKKRTPSKKAMPKKAKVEGDLDNDDDAGGEETPTKTPAKRGRKKKAELETEEVEVKQEDGDEAVESIEEAE